MSDILITESQILERMVDMGDGSFARKVATAAMVGSSPVSNTNPLPSVSPALAYVATNYTMTANQATGIDPVIPANSSRRALQFSAPSNFQLALAASQTAGMRIYASARDSLIGAECPLGALYLVASSGLNAGDTLTVWEA